MTPMTRDILSESSRRVWGNCFGTPVETGELSPASELDRLTVAAALYADDLKHMPETGLAQASLEERLLAAWAVVRVLRDVEAGRIGHRG